MASCVDYATEANRGSSRPLTRVGCLILDLRWKIGNETYCTAVSFPIYQPTLILYFSNIPMSENAIVAPTVPAPITATLEAAGVGIVALLVYEAICCWYLC